MQLKFFAAIAILSHVMLVVSNCYSDEVARTASAVDLIRAAGGKVQSVAADDKLEKPELYVSFDDVMLEHEHLEALSRLENVVGLKLTETNVTQSELLRLGNLQHLRVLEVEGDTFTNEFSTFLAEKCPDIERLSLLHTQVDAKGLCELAKLKSLSFLRVRRIEISQAEFAAISQFPNLTDLEVETPKLNATDLPVAIKRLSGFSLLTSEEVSGLGQALQGCTALKDLTLVTPKLVLEDLKAIGRLTSLEELGIGTNSVSDDSLGALGQLTRLRKLSLATSGFSSLGLSRLGNLEELRKLTIHDPTDDEVECICHQFPYLEVLKLRGAAITDDSVASIAKLSDLYELGIAWTSVTDECIDKLVQMQSLRSLTLAGNHLTAAKIEKLTELEQLESLSLRNTGVNEQVARKLLERLPNLHSLSLVATPILDESIRAMASANPTVEIAR